MSKKQTRRSISVTRATYERLKEYCDGRNLSQSGIVESLIREKLGMELREPTPKQGTHVPKARRSAPEAPTTVQPLQVVETVVLEKAPNKVESVQVKKQGTDLESIASRIFTF